MDNDSVQTRYVQYSEMWKDLKAKFDEADGNMTKLTAMHSMLFTTHPVTKDVSVWRRKLTHAFVTLAGDLNNWMLPSKPSGREVLQRKLAVLSEPAEELSVLRRLHVVSPVRNILNDPAPQLQVPRNRRQALDDDSSASDVELQPHDGSDVDWDDTNSVQTSRKRKRRRQNRTLPKEATDVLEQWLVRQNWDFRDPWRL